MSRQKIGEMLIAEGLIDTFELDQALAAQKRQGKLIGQILLGMEALEESDLLVQLSFQMQVPCLDLASYLVDPVIARIIPEHICRKHSLVAINKIANRLTVAMAEPQNIIAIDDIQLLTGLTVKAVIAGQSAILQTLDDTHGGGGGSRD